MANIKSRKKISSTKNGNRVYPAPKNGAGFTLVELLVVIAVIGILATIVVSLINPLAQFAKARNAQRKSDLRQLGDAIDRYYLLKGSYPNTNGQWCGPVGSSWPSCGADWIPGLIASEEVKSLPNDPNVLKANSNPVYQACTYAPYNAYIYRSDGTDYKLLVHCTVEGNDYSSSSPFYDPVRPTWAWQISTPGAAGW